MNKFFEQLEMWSENSSKSYTAYLLCELSKICSQESLKEYNRPVHFRRKLKELGYEGWESENRDEIEKTFDELIEVILGEFVTKYRYNKEYLLFILYNYKKWNSVAMASLMYGVNGEKIDGLSEFSRELNGIFNKVDTDSTNFHTIFKDMERFISTEKIGIEALLEVLTDTLTPSATYPPSESDIFTECNQYSHDIGVLLSVKNFVISNILKTTVKFKENGLISINYSEEDLITIDKLNYNNVKWLKDKEDEQFIVPTNLLEALGKIAKLRIGLNLDEIDVLQDTIAEEEDSWIVASIEGIEEYFTKRVKISDEDANKLLNLLVREPIPFNMKNYRKLNRGTRVTLKPIIPLTNCTYIFSDNVLIQTLSYIKRRLYDSNFHEDSLKKRFDKLRNRIDMSFEVAIKERLSKCTDIIDIKHNFEKINGTNLFVPNEIDLIILTSDKIYIAECKNLLLKSDYKALSNELQRMRKEYKTKLDAKISFVNKNVESILNNDFGITKIDKYKNNIFGVFITNNYSLTGSYHILKYPSINFTEIEDFFTKEI